MWQFKLPITMQKVCEFMDLDHEKPLDPETATSVVQDLSKGKFVEDHIRRFSASKDWKVIVGNKEEIKKILDIRIKADKSMADVNARLGAL